MPAHAHDSGGEQAPPRGDASPGRRGSGRREPGGLAAHGPVDDPVVTARALTKVFGRGESAVTALDAVDVHLARGRFTAVMGPSGSGKSTLMHCLAGLESPTSGTMKAESSGCSLPGCSLPGSRSSVIEVCWASRSAERLRRPLPRLREDGSSTSRAERKGSSPS